MRWVSGTSKVIDISTFSISFSVFWNFFLVLFSKTGRLDRDEYITIIFENIDPKNKYNFDKKYSTAQLNLPYDLRSIMHYESHAFSINGRPTIVSKVPSYSIPYSTYGQTYSELDILAVRKIYKCIA